MATQLSLSLNDQLLVAVPPEKWPRNFPFLRILKLLRNIAQF